MRWSNLLNVQPPRWTPAAKRFGRLYLGGVIIEMFAAYAHQKTHDQTSLLLSIIFTIGVVLVTLYYGFVRREISWIVVAPRPARTYFGMQAMLVSILHGAFAIAVAIFVGR